MMLTNYAARRIENFSCRGYNQKIMKRGKKMATVDLTKYGITGTTNIVYNPDYDTLYNEETKAELTGYDKGQVSIQDVLLRISIS